MSDVGEVLEQLNSESVKCGVCNANLSFDSMRPYAPQPDDVEPGHMKLVGASAIMSDDIEAILCDSQCLEAWESTADSPQNGSDSGDKNE